jgi:crotonobetainyl-CoA:carnitine CoA-transferase CaiB-like acyl-CoA transferase
MRFNLLEGIRVIEVGAMWAGPYAARILGDLGAEVIKVEGPRKPEAVRFGFYAENDPGILPWERGGHFQKFSRNKRGWVVDLTQQRGRDLLHALLRKSDILIENNTPRVRERLGLGHETLARVAPDLVVVSMPGFGDTGKYRDYLAFGLNMEGFAGLTSVTGYADDTPPIRSAIPYGDPVAALYGALSGLLGVRERRGGAPAPRFEVSQLEGLVSLLPDLLLEAQVTGEEPQRRGKADPLLYARQGTVRVGGNDWIAVSMVDEAQVTAVCALIGAAPSGEAAADTPAFWHALELWANRRGRDAAVRELQGLGIAAGPALSPGEMLQHEQGGARGV